MNIYCSLLKCTSSRETLICPLPCNWGQGKLQRCIVSCKVYYSLYKTAVCQPASFSHRLGLMGQILHIAASQEEQTAHLGALIKMLRHFMCFRWKSNEWGLGSRKTQKLPQLLQKGLFFLKLPRSHTFFQNTPSANSEASNTLLISLLGGYYETRRPFCWLQGSPAIEIWHLFDIVFPLEE